MEERGRQKIAYPLAVGVMLGRDVGQSLDLQHSRRMENRRQLLVGDAHFAVVHEAQQRFHVAVFDVTENHDRMLTGIRLFSQKKMENLRQSRPRNNKPKIRNILARGQEKKKH